MSPPIRPNRPYEPPRPDPVPQGPNAQPNNVNGKPVDVGQLGLDLTQMALDVAGLFDPTPVSDGANGVISLLRGDFLGAGISAVSMIPYVGDAAKLGKLGKWAETVTNGVELALKNSDFAKASGPALKKIADAIDAAPKGLFDKLPADAQQKLLEMRATLGRLPGAAAEGAAGSIAHKANAWSEYADRGGEWSYDRWSKTYEGNMIRATDAHRAADDLMAQRGWGRREVTVQVKVDGQDVNRRLDIADVAGQRGIEHKSGYQYLSQENAWELKRDAQLVKEGWDIEWVVDGTASEPLKQAARDAGIRLTVNP